MHGTLHTIRTLVVKYLQDLLKSPGLLVTCALPIAFVILFSIFVPEGESITTTDNTGILASAYGMMIIFVTVMTPGTATLYPMAEERDKGVLRTLLLAGVSHPTMLVSRGIAATLATAVTGLLCCLLLGTEPGVSSTLVFLCIIGSIPLMLFSLLCGLFARDQMGATAYSVPIVLAGIAPILFWYDDTLAHISSLFPNGGAVELARMLAGGTLWTPEAIVPALATLVWIASTAVALIIAYKRIPHEK